jgi:hypothetical protein
MTNRKVMGTKVKFGRRLPNKTVRLAAICNFRRPAPSAAGAPVGGECRESLKNRARPLPQGACGAIRNLLPLSRMLVSNFGGADAGAKGFHLVFP